MTLPRSTLLLLCLLTSPLLRAADPLVEAARADNSLAAGAYFGLWLRTSAQALDREQYHLLMQVLTRGSNQHTCMHSLILSQRFGELIEQLSAIGPSQELAATALATHAVLHRRWRETFAALPPPAAEDGGRWADLPEDRDQDRLIRVVVELLGHRDPAVRGAAAIAAANYASVDPALQAAMRDLTDETGVIPGARLLYEARVLGSLDAELAQLAFTTEDRQPASIERVSPQLCAGAVITPSAALAAEALGAFGGSTDDDLLPLLHHALRDHPDLRVQMEAARALGRIGRARSAAILVERMGDCDWPVFLACCEALTRCRDAAVMPDLIAMLDGVSGRSRLYLLYALGTLAGNQYGKVTHAQWQEWWDQQNGSFVIDDEASDTFLKRYTVDKVSFGPTATFYSLPILSDRLTFVLDRSGSMQGAKIETLIANATTALREMHQGTRFNVIDYDHEIERFQRGLTTDRRSGFAYVRQLRARGGTNIYDATFIGLMTTGITDQYLLTDGAPSAGQFRNWQEIMASMLLMTRYRPVAMSTIAIEAGGSTAHAMRQFSLMTGGGHVSLE